MTYQIAQPKCFIDVYTYEGGFYQISSANVLNTVTDKDIAADQGTFSLDLAPGGPNGANAPPSWTEVVTPMSLVVIGMKRDTREAIVMLGIVQTVSEAQVWNPGQPVQRVLRITGSDFSYFFAMFTYYSLWYLGATGAGVDILGSGSPAASLPNVLGESVLTGDPADVGVAWFSKIMAGTTGVLANAYVPYNNGRVRFSDAMATFFQTYDVDIPYGDYLIAAEGSWLAKFRLIFPTPYYEFFITTAGSFSDYAGSNGGISTVSGDTVTGAIESSSISSGQSFSSKGLGANVSGVPMLVARRNPLPQLTASQGDGVPSFNNIDASLWNALTLYTLDGNGSAFIQSNVMFDESQVQNFFVLNPTWMRSMFGQSNDNTIPYIFTFAAAGDAASIARYGFRPANGSFNWLADLNGNLAVNNINPNALQNLAGTLLARFVSYWAPTPLMARATVTTNLRPDILIGQRFRYRPFKSQETWDFYINRVTHNFSFDGPGSTTTLTLSRGLPSSVYADSGGSGLLYNIHIGNAQRFNGTYSIGLPAGSQPPLKAISTDQFQGFLETIGKVYVSAQAT